MQKNESIYQAFNGTLFPSGYKFIPNITKSATHQANPMKPKKKTNPRQIKEEFPPFRNLSDTRIPKNVNRHIVAGEVTIIIFVIPNNTLPIYKWPIPKGRNNSKRKAANCDFCLYEQYKEGF